MCIQETILADVAALVSLARYSERYIAKRISGNNTFVARLREGRVTIVKAQEAGAKLKALLAERQAKAKTRPDRESPAQG